jgi:hypothetical protein
VPVFSGLVFRSCPEAVMLDWLLWPADALLSAGGYIASWFTSKELIIAGHVGNFANEPTA